MSGLNKELLLTWLKEQFKKKESARDRLPLDHKYWEYHEGASDYLNAVIKAIDTGTFDLKEETES